MKRRLKRSFKKLTRKAKAICIEVYRDNYRVMFVFESGNVEIHYPSDDDEFFVLKVNYMPHLHGKSLGDVLIARYKSSVRPNLRMYHLKRYKILLDSMIRINTSCQKICDDLHREAENYVGDFPWWKHV